MSLVADAEGILKALAIPVKRDSKNPPYVRVDFGGSAALDEGLRRGSISVWIVLPWSQREGMQQCAGDVWRALNESGQFVCTSAADQTPAPSPDFNQAGMWAIMLISADSLQAWHTTS